MAAAIQPLKFLTVSPRSKHTATVIFVHGLGDTGHGWKPVADMFRTDPGLSHVKWVLPHSPTRAVTANMGMEMPSWFDILSFGFDSPDDEQGMLQSVHSLNSLISSEIDNGIEASNIVLGGFSQGGAMSLLTGLTTERKLAGLVIMSGWLPLKNKFKSMTSAHANTVPIFWGHGTEDPLVKYQFALSSVQFLKSQIKVPEADGTSIRGLSFNSYPGVGHSTNQKELDDLREWLKKALPQ
ncbi:hypothetical protein JAAARDRAFT_27753 [Jaapia argillacea MUCL 33604]|uniref:Acyl-protein thioesterase 1 n=1 Tax=Jaapia argillacea MUCL 33604 TaxID=933084 RepID=A0A067QAP5_9AGAM|nr:hypothetical protein JAAARDRAFT_27753 [Jaapia argillacea MUCL 33604]